MQTLYLNYGISIAALGLVGFLLTHAKSALISGLASGAILILISYFVEKFNIVKIIAKIVNLLLLGVFSWRTTLLVIALMNEHPEKLVPAILLGTMALVSLATLILSLSLKKQ
jgi:uncharacterized membrane protein (UPF0136 family)